MSRSHSNKDCSDDCKVRCGADVAAALIGKPRVRCHEKWRKNTDFDVEVEIDINPRCKITPKKHFQKDGRKCKHRCLLNVELDFDCDARAICNPCGKPQAEFRLDVEVPVKTECHIKRHGNCDKSKDFSKSRSNRCDKSKSKSKSKSRYHKKSSKSRSCKKRYWY